MLAAVRPELESYIASGLALTQVAIDEPAAVERSLPPFEAAFDKLEESNGALSDELGKEVDQARDGMKALETRSEYMMFIVLALAALTLVGMSVWLIRYITGSLARSVGVAQKVAAGDLSATIEKGNDDEFGELLAALGKMQQELAARDARDREIANANSRIKQALDSSGASVMVTDGDGRIVFVNRAAMRLFSSIEPEIRRDLPQFTASALVGSNFDQFHRNAGQTRGTLSRITSSHTGKIKLGSRTMSISAYPVLGEGGERLGYTVEWTDVTQELLMEAEVEKVIAAAAGGRLVERVQLLLHGQLRLRPRAVTATRSGDRSSATKSPFGRRSRLVSEKSSLSGKRVVDATSPVAFNGASQIGVGMRVMIGRADFDFIGDIQYAACAVCRFFGGNFFGITADHTCQRDDAFLHSDADLCRI